MRTSYRQRIRPPDYLDGRSNRRTLLCLRKYSRQQPRSAAAGTKADAVSFGLTSNVDVANWAARNPAVACSSVFHKRARIGLTSEPNLMSRLRKFAS